MAISKTITWGNIISAIVPIVTVIFFVGKMDAMLESQIELNKTQDLAIRQLQKEDTTIASRVQRNSEKFITAESQNALIDLKLSTVEHNIEILDSDAEENKKHFDEKFEELRELFLEYVYQK